MVPPYGALDDESSQLAVETYFGCLVRRDLDGPVAIDDVY
jgi:hypothetical protein